MAQLDINISANTLRDSLEKQQDILVLDVRPLEQRQEWHIPGSIHIDAYKSLKEGDLSVIKSVEIPEDKKVVTVCAGGRMSLVAAQALRDKGVNAYSLSGGMKGWTLAWNKATVKDGDLTIIQLRRTGKGCLSYMIGSGSEAIVIDASLESDIYRSIAAENGWTIKYVLDTHIHADHLSRSFHLAKSTWASLYMPAQYKLQYSFLPIEDGDELSFGSSTLKAIATPGHTLESMTYMVDTRHLFTGDTLFTDGVGRPDLKASEQEAKQRASMLYHSLNRLLAMESQTMVFPGHISKPIPFDGEPIAAKIEEIKRKVNVISLTEADFISNILSKIPPTPPNYLTVVQLNLTAKFDDVDPAEVEAGANRCAIS